MSGNLSSEELEALAEPQSTARRAGVVAPRDFAVPRRLCPERRTIVRQTVERALPAAERALRAWLRGDCTLALLEVGEASVDGLFAELSEPFVVQCFRAGGANGWLAWDGTAALSAVEIALGGKPPQTPVKRPLSPIETGLTRAILSTALRAIGAGFSLEIVEGELAQSARSLLPTIEIAPGADPQRVCLHLALDSPAGESELRLYLPGILARDGAPTAGGKVRAALPEHVKGVLVEVSAELATVVVPLAGLAQLEVGDVIPLGIPANAPLCVRIEGRRAARAEWGQHRGRLAVRVQEFETERD